MRILRSISAAAAATLAYHYQLHVGAAVSVSSSGRSGLDPSPPPQLLCANDSRIRLPAGHAHIERGGHGGAVLTIDWGKTLVTSNTTPTCQVVVEPTMWPNSPIRETQLHWLSQLGVEASPVFWQSWFVYPHTGVAELRPGEWDFSQITPLLQDMLNATQGRELVFQFGTVPNWMLAGPSGERRFDFGKAAWNDTLVWNYGGGAELAPDKSAWRNISAVGEYFANFISYYTAGGFIDAQTGHHYEGYHYNIPWFEFLNEMEYHQSPFLFTKESDIVTAAVAKVAPKMKFLGLGLGQGTYNAQYFAWFEYFLNSSNHMPGAPVADAIDYHYYAQPSSRTDVSTYAGMFGSADNFIDTVKQAEDIRKRLSPQTKTYLKELGNIAPGDNTLAPECAPLPDLWWSATAAYWAYLYSKLTMLQIDVASMSQLVGGMPRACVTLNGTACSSHHERNCRCSGSNFPSVTMLSWETGQPSARWFVLKMLVDAFGNRQKRLVSSTCTAGVCDSDRSKSTKPMRCAEAVEFKSIDLGCPAGKTIDSVVFASFGTPTGSCATGFHVDPACNANASVMNRVISLCVGKHNCSVTASSETFGYPHGHPCVNTQKSLAAQIHCTGDPPPPPPAPPGPPRGRIPRIVHAQAFEVTEHDGRKVKKLLLVNKGNGTTHLDVVLDVETSFKCMESIDGRAPWQPPVQVALGHSKLAVTLHSFGVAILTELPCADRDDEFAAI